MATSKLQLAVDAGKWDQGLRKAQAALNNFTKSQGGFGQAINKSEAQMKKFVQMLGNIDSTASNSRGQIREYKNLIDQLTVQFGQLSKAQKNGEIGQAMLASIENLKRKAAEAQDSMADLNEELRHMASDSSFADSMNMMASTVGNCASAMVAWSGDAKSMESVIKDLAKIQMTVKAIESLNKALQRQNLTLFTNKWALLAAAIATVGLTISKFVNDSERNLDDLNRFIDTTGNHINHISEECDFDVAIAEACGASKEELRQLQYEALKTRLALADLAYDKASETWNKSRDHWYSNIPGIRNADEQKQASAAVDEARKAQQDAWDAMNKFLQEGTIDIVKSRHEKKSGNGVGGAHATKAQPSFSFPMKVEKEEEPILRDLTKIMDEQFKNGFATSPFDGLQDKINNTMNDIKLEPIELSFDVDMNALRSYLKSVKLDNLSKTADNISRAFDGAANAVQSFGQNSKEAAMAASALTFAGTVASLMASMAKAQMQNKLGIWEWIAGGLAGVAALGTMISQMKSAQSQSFADGGTVQGSSYVGDRVPVMANAGEVILNYAQQESVANGLQRNDTMQQQAPYVLGQNIFLGLNNYLKSSGQGQLVTTKML